MKHQNSWLSLLTDTICNLQMMRLLKVLVWDYEFVGRIRTHRRLPFPLDMTSLCFWPHRPDRPVKMQREKRRTGWMSAQSISKSQPQRWLTAGEVTSVFTLTEIQEIVQKKKKKKPGVQNGLALNSQREKEIGSVMHELMDWFKRMMEYINASIQKFNFKVK